ncbi:BrnA antitoxin family protein [bacterium]|nr:BrnA antitoxin family protein [bacterium]
MPKRPKMLPHFETEEEELLFWETHHPADYIEGPVDVILRLKKRPKKTVTMRMDQLLYDRLRTVAAEHDVPYQRLIQEFVREGLRGLMAKERRRAKADT